MDRDPGQHTGLSAGLAGTRILEHLGRHRGPGAQAPGPHGGGLPRAVLAVFLPIAACPRLSPRPPGAGALIFLIFI